MRRLISFVCALGLILVGGFILFMQIFESDVISFGIVLAAGTALGFGSLWLWEEIKDPSK